jgi:drug/metabolite transporter (DMT)-like permease
MERGDTKLPREVFAGLVIAIVLDTIIQIAWKLAVSGIPAKASIGGTAHAALANPFFYAAMLAFVAQLFNWVRVLSRSDLSFVQPFTALSYLSVLAISAHSLHENISASKMLGVALILLGVFFISRTPFRTTDAHNAVLKHPESLRS